MPLPCDPNWALAFPAIAEVEPQRTMKLAKRRRVGKAAEKKGEVETFYAEGRGSPPLVSRKLGAGLLLEPAHMYHQLCL